MLVSFQLSYLVYFVEMNNQLVCENLIHFKYEGIYGSFLWEYYIK